MTRGEPGSVAQALGVAFNASPVTAHPTEAQLYRGAERSAGVQLFDEVETLRGDGKRFDALITVLNVGSDSADTVRLLDALDAIRQERGDTPSPATLLEALRARPGWQRVTTARGLAALLNPLGLVREQDWNGGQRRWCYRLDAGQPGVKSRRVRGGLSAPAPTECEEA